MLAAARAAFVVEKEMRMVCLGNRCMVWFLPRQSGCSRRVISRATPITLPVGRSPSQPVRRTSLRARSDA
jgi:hypothetical protein